MAGRLAAGAIRGCVVAMMLAGGAAAAGERASVSLAAGWAEGAGLRMSGLSFELAPGWKTYWRAPGEAGVPPMFDWSASRNLASISVEWPAPQIFDTYGMTTLGYADAVTLPLRVRAADPSAPVALRLTLDYGVCSDICVLEQAVVALDIAPDAPAAGVARVRGGMARAPLTPEEAGMTGATCVLEGAGEMREFAATLTFDTPWRSAPIVVVEGPPDVWFAPAAVRAEGGVLHVRAEAQALDGAGWISRDDLRLTVLGEAATVDVPGCAGERG
ncbi:protein-disulfide reductase DsbD domain-containing protein [Rubrimonas cliftonensis]|uniref:Thiol-disulfide interchange protein, contains DsbC and DsbD domains n=1 Tax=Rubrimonas cliftonensis TaxID=89524 RepID=A0A1H3W728_9RHOB|nr:protein-disulfide reductase DsbD domain-containing protein [Rubrimonas cliftonensis]SDZ82088.1 Thiol-disulfide interchange protein, contains DsbC and DsbD domains [Rubrimonas cliftonensis]